MEKEEPWLIYQFNQFRFSFLREEIVIYDKQYKREYKLKPSGNEEFPFVFMLERRD